MRRRNLVGTSPSPTLARESGSKAIRDSVTNLFDDETAETAGQQFGLLDHEKFKAACQDEGFEF